MYLVYLGESGNTGASIDDPNQQHHVHVGLLVHEHQFVAMNGEFNALCRRHFGRPLNGTDTPGQIRASDVSKLESLMDEDTYDAKYVLA